MIFPLVEKEFFLITEEEAPDLIGYFNEILDHIKMYAKLTNARELVRAFKPLTPECLQAFSFYPIAFMATMHDLIEAEGLDPLLERLKLALTVIEIVERMEFNIYLPPSVQRVDENVIINDEKILTIKGLRKEIVEEQREYLFTWDSDVDKKKHQDWMDERMRNPKNQADIDLLVSKYIQDKPAPPDIHFPDLESDLDVLFIAESMLDHGRRQRGEMKNYSNILPKLRDVRFKRKLLKNWIDRRTFLYKGIPIEFPRVLSTRGPFKKWPLSDEVTNPRQLSISNLSAAYVHPLGILVSPDWLSKVPNSIKSFKRETEWFLFRLEFCPKREI